MIYPLQIFNQPALEGLPNYHLIIEQPLDLGTIKFKWISNVYSTPNEFVDDVHLAFANAKKYNAETHEVYRIAMVLEAIFKDWCRNITTKMEIKTKGDNDDGDVTMFGPWSHIQQVSSKCCLFLVRKMTGDHNLKCKSSRLNLPNRTQTTPTSGKWGPKKETSQ